MPRSATEHPENPRGTNLLQEFEDSLPDFKSLDEEQHLKFVKTIRLLCGYFDISEARLRRDHLFKLKPTIARLSELYEEYHDKDSILASSNTDCKAAHRGALSWWSRRQFSLQLDWPAHLL
jgi:hypothetical protein